ncbi:MAG: hypothetical protein F6K50_35755 [Moorea sp. SIO3I7]|uniref:hypothetical protein n=1 Tax=Moorena bouillonii TaxID=207920 RepID=UPI001300D420|nr:hypothetical protein [Moorena bouillonii]NEO00609.1 hypothetical protein [Moorena sp. SIO3I7]NEO63541.1 hypothetical protein [Moorena sp. SIO4G2]
MTCTGKAQRFANGQSHLPVRLLISLLPTPYSLLPTPYSLMRSHNFFLWEFDTLLIN